MLLGLLGAAALGGCAGRGPESPLDWSPREGELTFAQARRELGAPRWCAPQSGGGMVCCFPARALVPGAQALVPEAEALAPEGESPGWEGMPVLLFGRDGRLVSGGWRHILRGAGAGAEPELNPYAR
jgi:hypothetical protein